MIITAMQVKVIDDESSTILYDGTVEYDVREEIQNLQASVRRREYELHLASSKIGELQSQLAKVTKDCARNEWDKIDIHLSNTPERE